MCPRVDINTRTEQCPSTNSDRTCINEDTIGVDEDTFSKLDIEPVIYFHRPFDPGFPLEESFIGDWVIQFRWQWGLVFGDTVEMS